MSHTADGLGWAGLNRDCFNRHGGLVLDLDIMIFALIVVMVVVMVVVVIIIIFVVVVVVMVVMRLSDGSCDGCRRRCGDRG